MATINRASSWFDDFWPLATAATGVGYLATAYAVARWLMRPSPAVVDAPVAFPSFCVERLECRTADGILLKGWALTPPTPRASVALFHGLRGNRGDLLGRIRVLTNAGYRCVAFDHRAHGESGGAWTSFGYHERHDVDAVAAFLHARWPDERCAALGCSMGAAALCSAGRAFDAFVLESMFHDLPRAFDCRVGCGYPAWFRYFRRGIIWFIEHRLALQVADVAPATQIARLAPSPILLVTGSEDPHAPPEDVYAIARAADNTQTAVIAGAGHLDLFESGGPAYEELLLTFLERHLCRRAISQAA